jgi:DMSO/TMAO reductase YedYZ molybdopterin-dependent catalytic subunit
VPLAVLRTLERRELTADFHCVAGWSATDVRWEGVAFATFHCRFIEPAIAISHVVFAGLDGHRSAATIEDVLAANVLIAGHLDGRPLDGDHGAPVRLVSPDQYRRSDSSAHAAVGLAESPRRTVGRAEA